MSLSKNVENLVVTASADHLVGRNAEFKYSARSVH